MDFQEDNHMLIATEGPKLEDTKTSAVIVGLAQNSAAGATGGNSTR